MPELRPETVQRYLPRLRDRLVRAARQKQLVTYGELIEHLGTSRAWIGPLLVTIAEQEHASGRPVLTAIVVHKGDREPGPGFWLLPMVSDPQSARARRQLWEAECNRVWNYGW